MADRVLWIAEMREKLGISTVTLYRWRKSPGFPLPRVFPTIGNGIRPAYGWLESDIDKWLHSREIVGANHEEQGTNTNLE